ncbi:MAG TPA: hypothetical protein VFH49_03730, partial [Aquabacterium sp.]|nr:hypothetical protein [Aquabacterium sp.]
MTLSTRTLMAVFAISNVSMVWLLAFSGLHGVNAVDEEVQQSASAAAALHLSMDADMMHDGIQAQVYRAVLHASEGRQADLADARQSLAQAVSRLEQDLVGVREQALPDDVRQRAVAAEPLAKAYSEEAQTLVQLAGTDAAQAHARLANFEQRFEALERSLDELGDAIGQQTQMARQRSDQTVVQVRQRVLFMTLAVTLALVSGLILFARFLWRTLGGEPMEAVKIAQAIAEGDLSVTP